MSINPTEVSGRGPMVGMGVYQILNIVNGKRYVGSTVNLRRRWKQHCSELACHRHINPHLQSAWNLYGARAFALEVLEQLTDPAHLIEREQHYIDALDPEYNLCRTAGRTAGLAATDDTRLAISKASKTWWAQSERRRWISETNRAWWAAHPERRVQLTARNETSWLKPEYRVRQQEKQRTRWADPEYRDKQLALAKQNLSSAKLTPQDVWEIRVLLKESTLTLAEIGTRYGVGKTTIGNIKTGYSWAHVA